MRKLSTKIVNVVQRGLKRWGNDLVKRLIWDKEFSEGRWDYIDHTTEDIIYHYLGKYSKKGSILDLGCGSGNTGNELEVRKYSRYTGVDISEEAIRKARIRSEQNERNEKNEYLTADISKYVPRSKYDIILFRESIHYVPDSRIKGMLDRYSKSLEEYGVLIVRMCDRNKYGSIVSIIEESYRLVEKYLDRSTNAIIIVFRPSLLSGLKTKC
jgi:2-polyprenyl-3-methyl-5-hydroxy-6-metoxy-1,4-benzoquinol methylase